MSREDTLDFLREVSVMNIAVAAGDEPMASVILFTVDDNFIFHFVTRIKTYKAMALAKNPKISFSVWEHNRLLVQGKGRVEPVAKEEISRIFDELTDSAAKINDFWPPVLSLVDGSDYIVYKINPQWIRVLDLANLKINEKENIFTQIQL